MNVDEIHIDEVSVDEFMEKYEIPSKPCVINGAVTIGRQRRTGPLTNCTRTIKPSSEWEKTMMATPCE